MPPSLRITVWNEHHHERANPAVGKVYPEGIHSVVAGVLGDAGHRVRTATLTDPEHGLTEAVLEETDVLFYWGHLRHEEVSDEVAGRVIDRILNGMGFVALHSAHRSKVFRTLMGTTCRLKWRVAGERERVWVVEPGHPIAAGLPDHFEVPRSEMYGERHNIPAPDAIVFMSWFEGGEVFRSGCCFQRGAGKIFFFSPGHESYPIYYQPEIRQVLRNAALWAAPSGGPAFQFGERAESLEPIERRRSSWR